MLANAGIQVHDGQQVMADAREIKSPDELACMAHAMAVCEAGMAAMRARLEPGVTENQVWAELNRVNAAQGGEWIETRLLSSGPRTNPWFQECGERVIRAGELVSFDTDLIGPYGMCCDVSRSFFCGPGRPSPEQRRLYAIAWEQIHHNMALLRPGVAFRELAEKAFPLPEACRPQRYSVVFHGVGLCDEYPHLSYAEDFDAHGYDGVVEAGMTLCVESYVGEVGGREGVKLEQQVVITETGCALLSTFPFEEELLQRWV
jgi:Xaa-Pro dipeptidase